MISPSLELQALIFKTLSENVDVMAVVSGVYDNVPSDAVFPYITLGASDEVPRDAECVTASKHTLTVDIWSEKKPKAECKQISFLVKKAIHNQPLQLTEHALGVISASAGRVVRDRDGITNHGTVTVSAVIEER